TAAGSPDRALGERRPFGDVDTAASERTVRGTTTGRRVGPLSVPGFIVVVLLVVAIAVAVAGGLGWLPLGALGVDHLGSEETASTRTMIESVGVGHGPRTGVQ
ncbi:serine/threonine protein kinase, partial [Brachybacterium sp. JB7]